MGNSLNSDKKEIETKLRLAEKTHVLNLSEYGLRSASSTWEKVAAVSSSLRTVDLSSNRFSDAIPPVIMSFSNVKSLTLSNCDISVLPDLSALAVVTTLRLDRNTLTERSIKGLPQSLTTLDLSFNVLVALPDALIGHASLKDLNLKGNNISDITGVESISALLLLNLDDNRLTSLPDHMSQLSTIKSISLINNLLQPRNAHGDQCIPASLLLDTDLQTLNLTGNTALSNKIVLGFEGVEVFLERRKKLKQKNFQGGAMNDFTVFGLT